LVVRDLKKGNKREYSLPKSERLRGKREIDTLFSTGKRFRSGKILFIYLPATEQRAGFFASRKVGGAAKRNRVKRILREAYRMNKTIFKGLRIIFLAQENIEFKEAVEAIKSFPEGR